MRNNSNNLQFDILKEEHLPEIFNNFNFPWASFKKTQKKWKTYFSEQQSNKRIVCIAKLNNQIIGYGSLLRRSQYPAFIIYGIPEIHDVWINENFRGKGYGKKLIEHIESIAIKENYNCIGIGVGLYKDYGKAQMLYVKLGYIPDGEGACYKNRLVISGESYPFDDDLLIWLKKDLSSHSQ